MSYDLMVFDPAAAPRERQAFRAWFNEQAEWSEDHGYDDPNITTPALQAWYQAMRQIHPNMNGPDPAGDAEIDRAADYNIGKSMIYVTFPWSLAEEAYPEVRRLAVECRVGFYDVSADEGDGEIYFPGDTLRPPSGGAWREIAAQFRDLSAGR